MAPQTDIAYCRVLLCEDDDNLRNALTLSLKREGFAVTSADDGQDAVRRLIDANDPCTEFDCVVMDYNLRFGFTGGMAVNAMRELCPDLPVVYLSGHDLPADLRAHEICLTKPAQIEDLVDAIARAIRSKADTIPPDPPVPTKPENPKGG